MENKEKETKKGYAVVCTKCDRVMDLDIHDEAIKLAEREKILKIIQETCRSCIGVVEIKQQIEERK
jgi:hypothetical protein